LAESDVQKVVEKTATTEKWLNDQTARQAERRKDEDVLFTSADLNKKREEVIYFCSPIINKPKPPPSKPATPAPESKPQTPGPESKPTTPAPDVQGQKTAEVTPEIEMQDANAAPATEEGMDVD